MIVEIPCQYVYKEKIKGTRRPVFRHIDDVTPVVISEIEPDDAPIAVRWRRDRSIHEIRHHGFGWLAKIPGGAPGDLYGKTQNNDGLISRLVQKFKDLEIDGIDDCISRRIRPVSKTSVVIEGNLQLRGILISDREAVTETFQRIAADMAYIDGDFWERVGEPTLHFQHWDANGEKSRFKWAIIGSWDKSSTFLQIPVTQSKMIERLLEYTKAKENPKFQRDQILYFDASAEFSSPENLIARFLAEMLEMQSPKAQVEQCVIDVIEAAKNTTVDEIILRLRKLRDVSINFSDERFRVFSDAWLEMLETVNLDLDLDEDQLSYLKL